MEDLTEKLTGNVVICNSGHDRGLYAVIVKVEPAQHGKRESQTRYYIADGRRRKAACPKAKNRKHFSLVNCRYDGDVTQAGDKDLRRLLHKYNFGDSTDNNESKGV